MEHVVILNFRLIILYNIVEIRDLTSTFVLFYTVSFFLIFYQWDI